MFTIAQHIESMETTKNTFRYLLSLIIIVGLGACSSTVNLPNDDVYYSSKSSNPTQYNWNDFQKSAQNSSYNNTSKDYDAEEAYGYETEVPVGAGADLISEGNQSDEYEFVDEYYDTDYASRISRFNDNGQSNDYYDDSYSSCGGCGGSNFSLSLGMGMGYGMSMGYGWPYYGYGYGYPYYGWGYPYYGGGYGAGYNNGYWDGYYAGGGYYGGGYGGGYYDYGYSSTYGPRGRGAGGSTIPRSGSRASGSAFPGSPTDNENIASKNNVINSGATSRANHVAEGSSGRVSPTRTTGTTLVASNNMDKAESNRLSTPRQNTQNKPSKTTRRYTKPTTTSTVQKKPVQRYQKPKSYESLPSRQPRSSKEYVRPTNSSNKSNASRSAPNRNNTNTYNRSVKQNSTRSNYSPRSTKSTSTKSSSTRTRSTSSPKSYSSPSRSTSSPSRSTYSSPSRSSSSSGRSSSSGSSSRSSGGRK